MTISEGKTTINNRHQIQHNEYNTNARTDATATITRYVPIVQDADGVTHGPAIRGS